MFVQIPNFPRYLIDETGSVASTYQGRWHILKSCLNRDGYLHVCINDKNGKRHTKKIHKLVMETFTGPANGLDVNHKDGVKTNNNLENLEYVTEQYNVQHAHLLGLSKGRPGSKHPMAKLTDEQAARLLALKGQVLQREAAAMFGVTRCYVSEVWSGKKWKHLHEQK